jgi:hypothetical protein
MNNALRRQLASKELAPSFLVDRIRITAETAAEDIAAICNHPSSAIAPELFEKISDAIIALDRLTREIDRQPLMPDAVVEMPTSEVA